MLCYAMLCYAMLCYAMLHYTILYYTISSGAPTDGVRDDIAVHDARGLAVAFFKHTSFLLYSTFDYYVLCLPLFVVFSS